MNWFNHRHWWRLVDSVELTADGKKKGFMRIESCSCGAIRQIEFYACQAPVVHMFEPETEK